MKTVRGLLLTAACWIAILAPSSAVGSSLPTGFRDDVVLPELREPTALRFSPDGEKVFVAEKSGRIVVFDGLGDSTSTTFADLRTQVYDAGDRGLLGLAVDPGFPSRPYVYALYTYDHVLGAPGAAPEWGEPDQSGDDCPKPPSETEVDDCPVSGRLVRLTVEEAGEGDHAVENGAGEVEQQVLVEDWCQQFSSHSIGGLEFGPDDALYASGGDGASFYDPDYGQFSWPQPNQCGDPPGGVGVAPTPPSAEGGALRAQDARTPADPTGLNGSVIRIDPDTGAGLAGNPFAASLDANARRIVAFGFRNPFRLAFDPVHGEVYVANVGWNAYEEIDRFAAVPSPAFNSGWPCYEGPSPNPNYLGLNLTICQDLYDEDGPEEASPPFFLYGHGSSVVPEDGCSPLAGAAVSGLAIYPGGTFPVAYDGALFFADSVRGCLYVMPPGDDGRPDPLAATTFMSEGGLYPGVDLEVGPEGNLFYVKLFGDTEEGTIHRISFDPEAPVARLSASPEWGPAPLAVELDASASSDSAGEPLDFRWDLDGDGSFETTDEDAHVAKSFGGNQNVEVGVEVSDPAGNSSVARVTLYPGDTPPRPEIEAPLASTSWGVGQEIEFAGGAADDEEPGDEIGEDGLYWKTRLYHCPDGCHAHPLQVFPAVDGGSFVAPDHDYPARIEVSLTATDSRGLTATEAVVIDPRTVDLTIASDPPGLELGAGPLVDSTPFELRAIEGSHVVLSAPPSARFGGAEHAWRSWSDGGARVHTVIAEESATYTASYPDDPKAPPSPAPVALPPGTRIVERPAKLTRHHTARFVFASLPAGLRFRCRLDRAPIKPCGSPRVYRHLEAGPHVFRVSAVDPDRVADPTPSVFRWQVLARPRAGAGER